MSLEHIADLRPPCSQQPHVFCVRVHRWEQAQGLMISRYPWFWEILVAEFNLCLFTTVYVTGKWMVAAMLAESHAITFGHWPVPLESSQMVALQNVPKWCCKCTTSFSGRPFMDTTPLCAFSRLCQPGYCKRLLPRAPGFPIFSFLCR